MRSSRSAVGLAVLLCACGGDVSSPPGPSDIVAVRIDPEEPVLRAVGDTIRLVARALDEAGAPLDGVDAAAFAWSSSDMEVATVTGAGLATAVSRGRTSISASIHGVTGEALLTALPVQDPVGSGYLHSCAVSPSGEAYCWGANLSGQLGDGTQTDRLSPAAVSSGRAFEKISAGRNHSCGLTAAGAVYCWGDNRYGQLGDGTTFGFSSTPKRVVGGHVFERITTGFLHSCGITSEGVAYCWGLNAVDEWEGSGGQLGDGTTTNRGSPTPVAGDHVLVDIRAGGYHTCAVDLTGAAYCWGNNGPAGQLGDGTTSRRTTPTPVAGALTFDHVSAGFAHTCGITAAGAAYCWGENGHGRLGDGTHTSRTTPTPVDGGLSFEHVSAGGSHTCGVTVAGDGYCWGSDGFGQLGNSASTHEQLTPTAVHGTLTFQRISAGIGHSCGRTTSGRVYCWGQNNFGQLGNGSTYPQATPWPADF